MRAKKLLEAYRPSSEFTNGVRKIRDALQKITLEAPQEVRDAIDTVFEEMIEGKDVMLPVSGKPLTTQRAADILQVSRSHLIKLLDTSEIPSHRVGAHRRVRLDDVLSYKEKWDKERLKVMRELTELSQEIEEE